MGRGCHLLGHKKKIFAYYVSEKNEDKIILHIRLFFLSLYNRYIHTSSIHKHSLRLSSASSTVFFCIQKAYNVLVHLSMLVSGKVGHGLINYIDTKAKFFLLKNWPVKGLCAQVFYHSL